MAGYGLARFVEGGRVGLELAITIIIIIVMLDMDRWDGIGVCKTGLGASVRCVWGGGNDEEKKKEKRSSPSMDDASS